MSDAWAVHCCGPKCHGSVTCGGSRTVFVNSLPAARVGDPVCCGSVIMTGSHNVFERADKREQFMNIIKKYSDLPLDFKFHPFSGDINPIVNIDAIKQSIRVLFSLDAYDIPFNPDVKSDMRKFLFEDLNAVTNSSLQKRLEWMIKTYEKRVKLIDIKIKPYETDDGFDITITYKIKALDVQDTFNYSFQRIR